MPGTPPSPPPDAERLILRVFLFGRLAPLSQAAIVATTRSAALSGVATRTLPVFALLVGESIALLPVAFSATMPSRRALLALEAACTAAALAWGAFRVDTAGQFSWLAGNLLYIFGMSATLLRSRREAIAAAGYWLAIASAGSAVRFSVVALWPSIWQAMALVLFMLLVFTLASEYRRAHESLDHAREQEVAQERLLAAERVRGRHYRALHDRVLQTMEFLARGRWITDPDMRAHVMSEAQWLRQLISGQLIDQPDELIAALVRVINAQAAHGLRTDLHAGQPHPSVCAEAVDAVAAAASEALTNVRKHANVDRAVMSVRPAGTGVLVTIVDDGCGFDPLLPSPGLGMRQSIYAQMRQVAGTATLHSIPGNGTQVELWVPGEPSPPAGPAR
jgi:signal transduction histidine kinase